MTDREARIQMVARELPRRNGQLARLLYRHSGLGLPRGMANILGALADRPHRITELASREGISQPAVTRILERLELKGLVERRRDEGDRRAVIASLTPRGIEELAQVRDRYNELLERTLADMSDADLEGVVEAIEALATVTAAVHRVAVERLSENGVSAR